MSAYAIQKGLLAPRGRDIRRTNLTELVELAEAMQVGDAVAVRLAEANQLRVILIAQGFDCITDGWQCKEYGKTLLFKMRANREPELSYDI